MEIRRRAADRETWPRLDAEDAERALNALQDWSATRARELRHEAHVYRNALVGQMITAGVFPAQGEPPQGSALTHSPA